LKAVRYSIPGFLNNKNNCLMSTKSTKSTKKSMKKETLAPCFHIL